MNIGLIKMMTKRWQIQSVFSQSSAAVPNSVSRHCNLARFILRSGDSICHRFFETAKLGCFDRRKGRVTNGTKTIQPQHRSARAGCRNVFYSNWAVQRFRIGNWQHRIITSKKIACSQSDNLFCWQMLLKKTGMKALLVLCITAMQMEHMQLELPPSRTKKRICSL